MTVQNNVNPQPFPASVVAEVIPGWISQKKARESLTGRHLLMQNC